MTSVIPVAQVRHDAAAVLPAELRPRFARTNCAYAALKGGEGLSDQRATCKSALFSLTGQVTSVHQHVGSPNQLFAS